MLSTEEPLPTISGINFREFVRSTRRNYTWRIFRENTLTLIRRPRVCAPLLLLQVAKLPIFRADRRFVRGVSNSNYATNGAPTERRRRSTFAKVPHPGLLFRFLGFATTTSKLLTDPDSFCASAELPGSLPRPRWSLNCRFTKIVRFDSRFPAEKNLLENRLVANNFPGAAITM